MLLSQKASEAEQEITRIRLNNMKTEEEKVHLERKTREAELLTERLVQESERRAAEAEKLKDELLRARIAEKEAKEKLLEFLSRNAYSATIPVSISLSTLISYEIISTFILYITFCLFLPKIVYIIFDPVRILRHFLAYLWHVVQNTTLLIYELFI